MIFRIPILPLLVVLVLSVPYILIAFASFSGLFGYKMFFLFMSIWKPDTFNIQYYMVMIPGFFSAVHFSWAMNQKFWIGYLTAIAFSVCGVSFLNGINVGSGQIIAWMILYSSIYFVDRLGVKRRIAPVWYGKLKKYFTILVLVSFLLAILDFNFGSDFPVM